MSPHPHILLQKPSSEADSPQPSLQQQQPTGPRQPRHASSSSSSAPHDSPGGCPSSRDSPASLPSPGRVPSTCMDPKPIPDAIPMLASHPPVLPGSFSLPLKPREKAFPSRPVVRSLTGRLLTSWECPTLAGCCCPRLLPRWCCACCRHCCCWPAACWLAAASLPLQPHCRSLLE